MQDEHSASGSISEDAAGAILNRHVEFKVRYNACFVLFRCCGSTKKVLSETKASD